MFDKKMLDIGYSQSTIRDLYTYGLARKKVIGDIMFMILVLVIPLFLHLVLLMKHSLNY